MSVRRIVNVSFAALLGIALTSFAAFSHAAPIPVPNGDFEDYLSHGTDPGDWSGESSGIASIEEEFGTNDEVWTNPSSFGSGWTQLTGRRSDGRFGLQSPHASNHHQRLQDPITDPATNFLTGQFGGHLIGFANLDGDDIGSDASGPQDVVEIQSQILGKLQPGVYTANLGVGFRANASWNDILYEIALVSGGVTADGTNGSTGGSVLGSYSSVVIPRSVGAMGLGNNQQLLTYVLNVGADHPNLGNDIAMRIRLVNNGTLNGEPSDAGTNDFTQANFDNATLDYVPEPASIVLTLIGTLALSFLSRRK